MKALVKTQPGPGHLCLLQIPEPRPEPGEAKIRVTDAGVCGTDVHILQGTHPVQTPLVLGHELSGVVVDLGPDVTGLSIGTRVTTETDAYVCGSCTYCRSGNEHLCPQRKAIGTTADGGFAEYLVIRAASVHPLPPGVSLAAGALSEPLAVAVHAVTERGQAQVGEVVVVVGPGTVGLLAAQVARAAGARVVLAGLERHTERFRLAHALGIEETILLDSADPYRRIFDLTGGLGADKVIECSGSPEAIDHGIQLLRKGGTLVAVGFSGKQQIPMDTDLLINKEISLLASRGKRHTCWPTALSLLGSGEVGTEPLITHRFPLEEWPAALAKAAEHGTKVVMEVARE